MIEVKRGGSKFGVEFHSDEYDTIISSISDAMKLHLGVNSGKMIESESSGDEEEEVIITKKPQNN